MRVKSGVFVVPKVEIFAGKIGGEPPEWVNVLPSEFRADGYDGTFLVDDISKQLVLERFTRRGNDIVWDYEHQTLYDVEAPAAGWIRELAAREDGVWARVDWTERAAGYVRLGEYRYFSPVFEFDPETLRVTALLQVALTNDPRTWSMSELTNQIAAKARAKYGREEHMKSWKSAIEKLKAAVTGPIAKLKEGFDAALAVLPDDPAAAARAEGVAEDATLASLLSLAPVAPAGQLTAKAVLGELGLVETAGLAELQAKVISLKSPAGMVATSELDAANARVAQLETELAVAKAGTEAQQIDALVAANKAKLPPAKEREIRAIAKREGLEHATKVVALLDTVLPASGEQAAAAPGAPVEQLASKFTLHGKELDVDDDRAVLAAKVNAHLKASKGKLKSYGEAYEDLKKNGVI